MTNMQIKMTLRYHLTPVGISKKQNLRNAGEDMEKLEPLHAIVGTIN
jgi:hypothetical protein